MRTRLLIILGVFNLSLVKAQLPNYIPSDSLIGWWPFNGNAIDSSGNGNNGSVNGAVLTTDRNGKSNSAYDFSSSGCGTRIDVDNIPFSSSQKGLSVSYWVYRSGSGCINPRLFGFWGSSNSWGSSWLTNGNHA